MASEAGGEAGPLPVHKSALCPMETFLFELRKAQISRPRGQTWVRDQAAEAVKQKEVPIARFCRFQASLGFVAIAAFGPCSGEG